MKEKNQYLDKKLEENPIKFKNPNIDEEKIFDEINELKEFIDSENEFWNEFNQGFLANVRGFYIQAKSHCDQLVVQTNEVAINNLYNQLRQHVNSQSKRILFSESSISNFLIRQYKKNVERANASYHVIVDRQIYQPTTNNLPQYLGNLEGVKFLEVLETVEEEERINELYDEAIKKHLEQISLIKEDYNLLKEYFNNELIGIQQILMDSESKFNSNIEDYKNTFDKNFGTWTNKISDLEKSYGAKLMLEKPAQYWKALRVNYEKKGKFWTHWSLGVSIVFIITMIIIFITFPDWMKGDFKLDHAKGVIILTVIISIFSYLIFTFVRLATSSYHLARDAEERRQLTFFYLSLIKEGSINDKDREIVLQSLFSRADTGLIKGDGAPTMPSGFGYLKEMFQTNK